MPSDIEKTRVLIADESEKVRRRLTSLLSDSRVGPIYEVRERPREILEHVEQFGPDVVIIDIHDSARSGIETLKLLRQNHPETDIIILTNKTNRFYRRACLDAGAQFLIDKSNELDQVKDALDKLRHEHPHV